MRNAGWKWAPSSPAELGKALKDDHAPFGNIIRDYGIKAE